MEILVKQKVMTCITGLWCVVLVLLVLGHNVNADEKYSNGANKPPEAKSDSGAKDANDPNELWWSRWDAFVKNPNDPNELLEAKWNAVVAVLQNKELDQELKKKIIDKIMSPIFDSELMAKLTLGKKHWPKLNEHQREEFTRLFADKLKTSYREKISLYDNEVGLFKPPVDARKGTIWIPMELVSDERKVELLYKLREADNRWKIYDVEIEGVSVLSTYRAQFDDILSRGTVEDLFARLAEKQPAR